jgi:hypothetical protein
MTNAWYRDPRAKDGELKAFDAERAERRNDPAAARALHHEAAEAFAAVALSVPADHPETRSTLAIAAVASFARAGDLGRAGEFGRRMLVETDALSERGRAELARLVKDYAELVASAVVAPTPSAATRKPTLRANSSGDNVRRQFQRPARSVT